MQQILMKVFLPQVCSTFSLAPFKMKGKHYYFIKATALAILDYDFICLKWLEKIRLVHLYLFLGNPNAKNIVMKDYKLILQN